MIEYLDGDPPPAEEQWQQIREKHLGVLRGECAELQSELATLRDRIRIT